jgi:hypothetical protein
LEVDFADKVPPRIEDYSAGYLITQHFAMLGHSTLKDREALLLFENSNEELDYLECKHAHLEKPHKIESLQT